jgi:imidazolonepropionase
MNLACTQIGLSPAEALAACTVNAAHVLGLAEDVVPEPAPGWSAYPTPRRGRLAPGNSADLVLLETPDWRHVAYHLGGPDVAVVVESGAVAWTRSAA